MQYILKFITKEKNRNKGYIYLEDKEGTRMEKTPKPCAVKVKSIFNVRIVQFLTSKAGPICLCQCYYILKRLTLLPLAQSKNKCSCS